MPIPAQQINPAVLWSYLFPHDTMGGMIGASGTGSQGYAPGSGAPSDMSPALLRALSAGDDTNDETQYAGGYDPNPIDPTDDSEPQFQGGPTGAAYEPPYDEAIDEINPGDSDVDDEADLRTQPGDEESQFVGGGGYPGDPGRKPPMPALAMSNSGGIGAPTGPGASGDDGSDPEAAMRSRVADIIAGIGNAHPSDKDKGLAIMMAAAGMGSADPRTGLVGALLHGAGTAAPFYANRIDTARRAATADAGLALRGEGLASQERSRKDTAQARREQMAATERIADKRLSLSESQGNDRTAILQQNADTAATTAAARQKSADALEEWRGAQAGRGNFELTGTKKGDDGSMYPVYTDKFTGKSKVGDVPVDQLAKGANGGKTSVFAQKQQAWLAVHPGDDQGSLDYASGHRDMSVLDGVKAARAVAADAAKNADVGMEKEDYNAAFRKALIGMGFDPDGSQIKKITSGAAAAPKPATAAPSARSVATPTTREELDALAPDSLYVNPADGITYRKK